MVAKMEHDDKNKQKLKNNYRKVLKQNTIILGDAKNKDAIANAKLRAIPK